MKKEKIIRFEEGRIGIAICETIQRLKDRDAEIAKLKSDVKALKTIVSDLRIAAENASYTELRPFVSKYQRVPGTNSHDSYASKDKWKGAEAAQSYFCGLIRKAFAAARKVKP